MCLIAWLNIVNKVYIFNFLGVAGAKLLHGNCHVGFNVTEPHFMDYLIGVKLSGYP